MQIAAVQQTTQRRIAYSNALPRNRTSYILEDVAAVRHVDGGKYHYRLTQGIDIGSARNGDRSAPSFKPPPAN